MNEDLEFKDIDEDDEEEEEEDDDDDDDDEPVHSPIKLPPPLSNTDSTNIPK